VHTLHRLTTLEIRRARAPEAQLPAKRVRYIVDRRHDRTALGSRRSLLSLLKLPKCLFCLGARESVAASGRSHRPDDPVQEASVERVPAAVVRTVLLVLLARERLHHPCREHPAVDHTIAVDSDLPDVTVEMAGSARTNVTDLLHPSEYRGSLGVCEAIDEVLDRSAAGRCRVCPPATARRLALNIAAGRMSFRRASRRGHRPAGFYRGPMTSLRQRSLGDRAREACLHSPTKV
jgi:hypothetical protein